MRDYSRKMERLTCLFGLLYVKEKCFNGNKKKWWEVSIHTNKQSSKIIQSSSNEIIWNTKKLQRGDYNNVSQIVKRLKKRVSKKCRAQFLMQLFSHSVWIVVQWFIQNGTGILLLLQAMVWVWATQATPARVRRFFFLLLSFSESQLNGI